jgi:hypothetical protein
VKTSAVPAATLAPPLLLRLRRRVRRRLLRRHVRRLIVVRPGAQRPRLPRALVENTRLQARDTERWPLKARTGAEGGGEWEQTNK